MELERETAIFQANLEKWQQSHVGEFVLIKGDEVVGFFPRLDEAFAEGTRRFGLENFFIKQIMPKDSVNVSLLGKYLRSA